MAEIEEVATVQAPENAEDNEPKQLTTKEAYFASLAEWARQSNQLQMFWNFLNFTSAINQSNPVIQEEPQPIARAENQELIRWRSELELVRLYDEEQREHIIHRWGGAEMLIAPFWKRAMAEMIDNFIINVLKIIFALLVHNYTEAEFERQVNAKGLTEEQVFFSRFEISLDLFLFSNDVLAILFATKLVFCLYEAMWLVCNNGSTPGKYWMNLRVLYVESVVPLGEQREGIQIHSTPFWAHIYPAVTPDGATALLRVITKHLIVTCVFPVWLFLIYPRNNRTTYDILSKTVVVEKHTERRPTQPRPLAA